MFKGVEKDAVYYALIIIFLGFTLYLLSPALFRQAPQTAIPPIITTPSNITQVNITLLTSSKCKILCETDKIKSVIKKLLLSVHFNEVEVESPTGKELASKYNISLVPSYIFDESLKNSPFFSSFSVYVRQSGRDFILDTLDTESGYLFGRISTQFPALTLVGASYDINSIVFQNTTFKVLQRFNDTLNFTLRFAVKHADGNFSSINGYSELVEDTIQVCALESGSKNTLNAISCRSNDILNCYSSQAVGFCAQFWKVCVGGWGINETLVEQCVRTKNNTILLNEAKFALENEIKHIPTIIIGNQYKLVGNVSEVKLLSYICGIYPTLQGCVLG